ncbi:hypothetical protein MVEN_00004300 [Mycena venus]|uniref:Cyanovirin-N domain-containing protein n=1 Tax=Mycena venus TaxID=2733690 RepID=A0A8H6Z682_9AGAR|nr:hypothetical protein MVEN_00004300 [Mycena venus]
MKISGARRNVHLNRGNTLSSQPKPHAHSNSPHPEIFIHNQTETMSFAESSLNYRLVNSTLFADCRDENGQLRNSQLDLNQILGNKNGAFDPSTAYFHESCGICGLNGTVLVATLRAEDGKYRDAKIDLNSFITNENGSLSTLKHWHRTEAQF